MKWKKYICFGLCAFMISGCSLQNTNHNIPKSETAVLESNEGVAASEKDKDSGVLENEKKENSGKQKIDSEVRRGFMAEGEKAADPPENYIPIHTVDELKSMGNDTQKNYILMEDINMQGVKWDTSAVKKFSGVFDGNYHKIRNMNNCLMNSIKGGTIKNIAFEDVETQEAALALEMIGGTVSNCYVSGNISGSGEKAGGLIAQISLDGINSNVNNCYNLADVSSDYLSSVAGGIIGKIEIISQLNAALEIQDCENYGNISGCLYTGGIVGYCYYDGKYDKNKIRNVTGMESALDYSVNKCFNYGSIEAQSGIDENPEIAGGILGRVLISNGWDEQAVTLSISQSANYSSVDSPKYAGGVCGDIEISTNEKGNTYVLVTDCMNAGAVQKDKYGHGICGRNTMLYGGIIFERCINIGDCHYAITVGPSMINGRQGKWEITDCYYTNGESTAEIELGSADETELEEEEIKNPDNLENFKFPFIWGMNEKINGFPHPLNRDEADSAQANYKEWENQKLDDILADESKNSINSILLNRHYADMLACIGQGSCWPEDDSGTYQNYLSEYDRENKFAVYDIDGDGIEELLVEISSASMAEMRFVIYQYDLENDTIKVELDEFINNTFYDNGIIVSNWSHNQGLGDAIFPYNVYQYDKNQDAYVKLGDADSWNREFAEKDWNGNAFPDSVDRDGDGNIYFISDAEGKTETVDGAEFDKWENSLFGNAKEVEIDWKNLKSENYSIYTKAYLKYCLEQAESSEGFDSSDIGYVYMKNEGSQDAVKKVLSSEFGIDMQSEEDGFEYIGNYDGQPVIAMYAENGGSIVYQNTEVTNLNMFGIHPGMRTSELEEKLKIYGFESHEYGFATGDATGNYYLNFSEEGGIVQNITVYLGGRYVG